MVAMLAVHGAVIALVIFLRFRSTDGRISPDGQFYLDLCIGRPAPKPYCYRVLLPLLVRPVCKVAGVPPLTPLRVLAASGTVLAPLCVYAVILLHGGTAWQGLAGALVLIGCNAAFTAWLFWPWLTDSWSVVFGVCAIGVVGDWPILAAVFLLLAALTKEGGYALAAAFILVTFPPSAWWVVVPGVVALAFLRVIVTPAPPNHEWLKRPFSMAHATKFNDWFVWTRNLRNLGPFPYAACYWLPTTEAALGCAAVVGLAYLQTQIAMDHQRLIALAVPFLLPWLVLAMPPGWLAVFVLLSIWWPFAWDGQT